MGVEVFLYAVDLGVEGFGDEEVGAVPEVFYEALGGLVGCGRGEYVR